MFNEISSALTQNAELFIGVALVFGVIVGSFLNVVIHRVPKMMELAWERDAAEIRGDALAEAAPRYNLVVPRSSCPSCGHRIKSTENIPIISWLMLGGKCAGCKTPISKRYPIVELVTGLLCAAVAWRYGWGLQAFAGFFFVFILVSLTGIDLDTMLLPDDLTLPLLWVGLLLNVSALFVPLSAAVIGAALGYLSLWSIFWIFKLVTGKEGMGYGDFKLLAALGAWFGWEALPAIIILSSAVGAVVGISLMLFKGLGRETPIPFGPYLAGAGLLYMFFGSSLRTLI
jgi:leader peptidase (prepilin peptidase) / N-methyltransferase